jgi:hypothetical protein
MWNVLAVTLIVATLAVVAVPEITHMARKFREKRQRR